MGFIDRRVSIFLLLPAVHMQSRMHQFPAVPERKVLL